MIVHFLRWIGSCNTLPIHMYTLPEKLNKRVYGDLRIHWNQEITIHTFISGRFQLNLDTKFPIVFPLFAHTDHHPHLPTDHVFIRT